VPMDERPGPDPPASTVGPEDATPRNQALLPRASEEALAGTGTAMLRRCHTDVTFGGEKAHHEETTRGFGAASGAGRCGAREKPAHQRCGRDISLSHLLEVVQRLQQAASG